MPSAPEQGLLCRAAIRAAERSYRLPADLLPAIARVESGRRDPQTGAFHPWPWTVNAEGRGYFFDTKAEAVAFVREQQARGVRSLDVGCMQVNLLFHPAAFPSLEDAFDPRPNTAYAARFLTELYAKSGSWEQAGANYHSWTPHLAEAYQRRLLTAWAEERRNAGSYDTIEGHPQRVFPGQFPAAARGFGSALVGQLIPGQISGVGRVIPLAGAAPGSGAMLSNGADRALVFRAAPAEQAPASSVSGAGFAMGSGRHGAGRGLDVYRAAPIPLAYAAPAASLVRRQ